MNTTWSEKYRILAQRTKLCVVPIRGSIIEHVNQRIQKSEVTEKNLNIEH